MNKTSTISNRELIRNLEKTTNFKIGGINLQILEFYSKFTLNHRLLITSFVQNPYGLTTDLKNIRKKFGFCVTQNIITLNDIQRLDQKIFKDLDGLEPLTNLYLVNLMMIIKNRGYGGLQKYYPKKKLKFALGLLNQSTLSIFKEKLEDDIFSLVYPKKFTRYLKKRKLQEKEYIRNMKNIKQSLEKKLAKIKIKPLIFSRLKTISSINKKMLQKDILFEQINDILGLRIVVDRKKDCYRIMEIILSNWAVKNDKIKDFISIPKENGYQSLHLTIETNGIPIEVQIRTFKMDKIATYGSAAHYNYKLFYNG
ncbi:MAG: hypothetical protein GF347_02730 [Candidatus Moranbacteria bacterium]|nr:hypothetical protein [Candidatus Moranbacteria bacterium]